MTKTILQTLLELWQASCCDHFPEDPVPVTNHPLRDDHFPNVQSELSLTVSFHSFMSCCWSPERDQNLPLRCPLEEAVDCGEVTPQPSPRWTSQVTSAAPHKPCPQGLSPSWLSSFGHTLIVWCLYIEAPKTALSTRGGATPVQRTVGQSLPSTI